MQTIAQFKSLITTISTIEFPVHCWDDSFTLEQKIYYTDAGYFGAGG